jgi:hypothetical protein
MARRHHRGQLQHFYLLSVWFSIVATMMTLSAKPPAIPSRRDSHMLDEEAKKGDIGTEHSVTENDHELATKISNLVQSFSKDADSDDADRQAQTPTPIVGDHRA